MGAGVEVEVEVEGRARLAWWFELELRAEPPRERLYEGAIE